MFAIPRRSAAGLAVLLCASLAVPARGAGTPLGAETPEKVVARMRAAAEKKDFRELAACLAPEPRKQLAQMIWLGATMMVGMATSMGQMGQDMAQGMADAMNESDAPKDDSKTPAPPAPKPDPKLAALAAQYDVVAKKHGLPGLKDEESPEMDPEKLFDKVDAVEMVGDFGALLESVGEATGEKAPSPPVPDGKLEGLKIEGDKATGMLDGEPIQFVKLEGRWYVADLPKKPEAPE